VGILFLVISGVLLKCNKTTQPKTIPSTLFQHTHTHTYIDREAGKEGRRHIGIAESSVEYNHTRIDNKPPTSIITSMSQSINIWNMVDSEPTNVRRPSELLIPVPPKPNTTTTAAGMPHAIGPHPLFKGIEEGNVAGVKDLILRGCAIDVKDFAGRTILHRACELGQTEIVRFLLERKGSYLTAVDRKRWTVSNHHLIFSCYS